MEQNAEQNNDNDDAPLPPLAGVQVLLIFQQKKALNPEECLGRANKMVRAVLHALERRALTKIVFYPQTFALTLMQLGHEPFPLSKGKRWLFCGSPTNFLPNLLIYLKNLCLSHGLSSLYAGVIAHLASWLANDLCCFFVVRHMNEHYPELGGRVDDAAQNLRNSHDLTAHQFVRVLVRQTIRTSVTHCIAAVCTRPFLVLMNRQIAQFVAVEAKYASTSIVQPLRLICAEEGSAGLLAGLIPQLVGDVLFIWTAAVISPTAEVCLNAMGRRLLDLDDPVDRWLFAHIRWGVGKMCGILASAFRHPFYVVSTVMAINGSGLTFPMLPFTPLFAHWTDLFTYLWPFALYRGRYIYLREYCGPIRLGSDGKMYALIDK